ncbi:trypsin-like peptidase domain-containing protein [Streptomyces sp. NRRL S-340]|uniref:S1C family serine protease n=1 Tax=Streptomyces sp. NRRL S-340 TaxID=1463901 RepID=UPI00099DD135
MPAAPPAAVPVAAPPVSGPTAGLPVPAPDSHGAPQAPPYAPPVADASPRGAAAPYGAPGPADGAGHPGTPPAAQTPHAAPGQPGGPVVPAPATHPAVLPDSAVLPRPAAPAGVPPQGIAPADVPPPGTVPADVPPPPAPAAAPTDGAVPATAPPGAGAPAPHAAAGPAGAVDPWQRYDPWAVRPVAGPLLESGAGSVSGERRRGRARRSLVGGAVLLALAAGVAGGVAGAYLERNGGFGTVELPQAGKEPAGRAPDSVAGIAARALPSVVTLHVSGSGEQDTGTGFVLDRLGHILTNNHVVGPAASGGDISVTFNGGQTARGTIVGRDTGYDLAVVQVRGVRGLTPMPLGNSDNVRVGDPVVAIGAPFDLADTVTSGIISAKERPITAGGEKGDGSDLSYVDALQTDAPINPGNSGGPLLDSRGRVVGINSAIRSADTGSDVQTGQAGSIGLGFAIPVNQAKRVAEELINTGRASHPVIGVTLDMAYPGDGAKVGDKAKGGGSPVTPGGPGAKAGIRAGDVITAVDGVPVHSGEELIVRTRAHRPGDRLDLTVERGGQKRRVTLVLGSSDSG